MADLTQFGSMGVFMTAGSQFFARFAFLSAAEDQLQIHPAALVFLICISAGVGALIHHLCAKTGNRKRNSKSAMAELAMLRDVVANMPDPIYVKDSENRFLLANQRTADVMGAATGSSLLGKTDFDFYPEEIAAGFREDERKIMLSGQPLLSHEEYVKNANGKILWTLTTKIPMFDDVGRVIGLFGIGRDITALKEVQSELGQARNEMEFKATHDSLTSLLNREAILEMLEHELTRSIRENSCMAILLGDLDHFKNINDTHGHPIGDEVLREAACRLLGAVRTYDLVGRYGGEEFLIVLPGCAETNAFARAEDLRVAISASPIMTSDGPISITISLGVLVTQQWGAITSAEILRKVDAALYVAKDAGRNRSSLALPPLHVCAQDENGSN